MLSIMLIAFIQSNIHIVDNSIYSTYPIPSYLPPSWETCNNWPTFCNTTLSNRNSRLSRHTWRSASPSGFFILSNVSSIGSWQNWTSFDLPPSFRPLTGNIGYYKLPPGTSSVSTSLPSVKRYKLSFYQLTIGNTAQAQFFTGLPSVRRHTSSVFTHLPSVKITTVAYYVPPLADHDTTVISSQYY